MVNFLCLFDVQIAADEQERLRPRRLEREASAAGKDDWE